MVWLAVVGEVAKVITGIEFTVKLPMATVVVQSPDVLIS